MRSPELPARLHERLGPELRILRVVHFDAESAEEHAAGIVEEARNPHVDAILVDSRTAVAAGGTGVAFDWEIASKTLFQQGETPSQDEKICKFIAAGGLNPANVAEAIALLRPWGVDVASGVEAAPGARTRSRCGSLSPRRELRGARADPRAFSRVLAAYFAFSVGDFTAVARI
jgi:phosphoribosylanthranilate isomerase